MHKSQGFGRPAPARPDHRELPGAGRGAGRGAAEGRRARSTGSTGAGGGCRAASASRSWPPRRRARSASTTRPPASRRWWRWTRRWRSWRQPRRRLLADAQAGRGGPAGGGLRRAAPGGERPPGRRWCRAQAVNVAVTALNRSAAAVKLVELALHRAGAGRASATASPSARRWRANDPLRIERPVTAAAERRAQRSLLAARAAAARAVPAGRRQPDRRAREPAGAGAGGPGGDRRAAVHAGLAGVPPLDRSGGGRADPAAGGGAGGVGVARRPAPCCSPTASRSR